MGWPPVIARAELRGLLGVSDARVSQLLAAEDFPEPIATLSVGRVWSTPDVLRWCEAHGRKVTQAP